MNLKPCDFIAEIVTVLANPHAMDKYPIQLGEPKSLMNLLITTKQEISSTFNEPLGSESTLIALSSSVFYTTVE